MDFSDSESGYRVKSHTVNRGIVYKGKRSAANVEAILKAAQSAAAIGANRKRWSRMVLKNTDIKSVTIR